MGRYYDPDGNPIPQMDWARRMEADRWHLQTLVGDDVKVSTVYLGLNHNFLDDGPPLIFETMIFGGPLDDTTYRYSSRRDAEAGHAVAVRRAEAAS